MAPGWQCPPTCQVTSVLLHADPRLPPLVLLEYYVWVGLLKLFFLLYVSKDNPVDFLIFQEFFNMTDPPTVTFHPIPVMLCLPFSILLDRFSSHFICFDRGMGPVMLTWWSLHKTANFVFFVVTKLCCVLLLVTQSCPSLEPPGTSVHADSPGRSTEVGCHALLQGISPVPQLLSLNLSWILALVFMTDTVFALMHLVCHPPLNSSHPLLQNFPIDLNKKA